MRTGFVVRAVSLVLTFAAFGLFFAYDVFSGIGNFIGIENQAARLGIGLTGLGWFIIYTDVLLPALVWLSMFVWFVIVLVRQVVQPSTLPVLRFVVALGIGLLIVAVIELDFVLGVPATVIFKA